MAFSKMKPIVVIILAMCLWVDSPALATNSLDFLKTNSLYDEIVIDYRSAAMAANILEL